MQYSADPVLLASYFDGSSARARAVALTLGSDGLLISGDGFQRQVALQDITWPERTVHGRRVAHLADGGSVQCEDAGAWDAWSRAGGRRDPWIVRMQQSWGWVAGSVLALVLVALLLQQWGLPWASKAVVAAAPWTLDQTLGDTALSAIDTHLMRPSALAPAEQERLRAAFARALAAAPAHGVPPWRLLFRSSRIGPNALALPGGTLLLTDELVQMVDGDAAVVTAVLAHELGHVRHRHGLRMLVQVGALGALSALVLGDFSTVLAGAPVLLGQSAYSRDAEREADVEAVRLLQAARIDPAVMATLFDKLAQYRARGAGAGAEPSRKGQKPEPSGERAASSWLGIAFASHPPDADRVRYFREAGLP